MLIDCHTHKIIKDKNHFSLYSWVLGQSKYSLPTNYRGYYTAGYHPWYLEDVPHDWLDLLNKALSNKSCVALGEIGLDYYFVKEVEKQKNIFVKQLQLAIDNSINCIVLHCVRAHQDMIDLIKDSGHTGYLIWHDFSGSEETMKSILRALPKSYFSYSRSLFRNKSKGFKSFIATPINHLLLETDDLEESIGQIYDQAKIIRKSDSEELERILENNFLTIFDNLIDLKE